MLAHGFDPVETQRVQHGTGTLHNDQDGDGKEEPDGEEDEDGENAGDAGHAESVGQSHGPQDDRELLVSKRQGPETEVRCGVGDTVEAEFCEKLLVRPFVLLEWVNQPTDGVNDLVDHDLTELELLAMFLVDALGDHSSIRVGGWSAVCVVLFILFVIKCGDTGVLANATVTLSTGAVVLPAKVEWLEEQQNWHL
jgi:hypothetical protein